MSWWIVNGGNVVAIMALGLTFVGALILQAHPHHH